MVNPTGAISSGSSVDDRAVAQLKQESVIWILRIASRLIIGGTFADTSSAIFDNLRPLANGADRKHPAPMNRRATDAPAFAFLHWTDCQSTVLVHLRSVLRRWDLLGRSPSRRDPMRSD